MAKSQATPGNALPLIIFSIIGAFILYLMWVTPSERLCFLGYCDQVDGQPIPAEETPGIASFVVGFIGGASGDLLSTHILENIRVSRLPEDTKLFSDDKIILNSNFIVSEKKKYTLNNFNNASDHLFITYRLAESTGNPSIRAIINGEIYEDSLSGDTKEIIIPPTELLETNEVDLVCQYHGLSFWKSQSCTVREIEISARDYPVDNSIIEREFTIKGSENFAENAVITFLVNNAVNKGNLRISLNEEPVYNSNPETGEIVQIKEKFSPLQLNTIRFSAEKGASYEIDRVNVTLAAGFIERQSETFTFKVSPSNLNKQARIFAEIKNTIIPGRIAFTLYPEFTTYQTLGIPEGFKGWVSIPTSIDGFTEEENTIRIQSIDGRFEIGTLKIVLEQ